MKSRMLLFLCSLVGVNTCAAPPAQTPVVGRPNALCGPRYHDARPNEIDFIVPPELMVAFGEKDDNNGLFGRASINPPNTMDGLAKMRVLDDGADLWLDFEGSIFFSETSLTAQFTFVDDMAMNFAKHQRWCSDGSYAGEGLTPFGYNMLFGTFRRAQEDEAWSRATDPELGNTQDTEFQVFDVRLYNCPFTEGKGESWYQMHCEAFITGTLQRRR